MERRKIIFVIVGILIIFGIIYYFCNYGLTLADVEKIKTVPEYEDVVYDEEENILSQDVLGILIIEKIGLKATVKEGSDKAILENYIGHIENTSTYDGNIGLAAHNRGFKNSFFARINELEGGDVLIYKTKFYTRKYKVDNIQTIWQTDWTLLKNTDENKITMITCVPNKRNQRLCVQATEI